MALAVLDYETYYDSSYRLKQLTTEEYIRDRRFEVIGFSLKLGDGPTRWYTGTREELFYHLNQVDWSTTAMAAHNCRFDAAILNWHFGLRPAKYLDTMSMARGLVGLHTSCSLAKLAEFWNTRLRKGDEVVKMMGRHREDLSPHEMAAYGEYCKVDTEICFELLNRMAPLTLPDELKLQDWTVRAYVEPKLILDQAVLEEELRNYYLRKNSLLAAAGVQDITTLRSDATLASLLQSLGVDPPTKLSPKRKNADGTPMEVYAFAKSDLAFQDLLEDDDERVAAVVEARLGLKTSIVESRLQRLLGIAKRGPMPMPMVYAGATPTRRWSGDENINVQNFPRNKVDKVLKDANGRPLLHLSPLRRAITAPPGKLMAAPDLSQIELRVNCWQSGQRDVLELLRGGGDTYADMATDVFGFPVNKKDHESERFVGKTAVLGCGYQCGGPKFQTMLKVDSRKYGIPLADTSLEFAQRVVDTFRAKNPRIKAFWYAAGDQLQTLAYNMSGELGPYTIRDGKVWLPNGSFLYYPDLRYMEKTGEGEQGCEWSYQRYEKGHFLRKKIYGGKFVENITQAVARLFVSDALLRLETVKYANGQKVFDIVFSVHDELVVLFDENLDLKWVRDTLTWALTTTPPWAHDIPLGCEIGIGKNYAEVK